MKKLVVAPISNTIIFGKCGTPEQWEKYKENYPDMYVPIPATIYVSQSGCCLVTSQEWVDWLQRKTDVMPTNIGGSSNE